MLYSIHTVDLWVERMRNPTCIDCGYHVEFRIRSTRPTHLIYECYKYLPKYRKLNSPATQRL